MKLHLVAHSILSCMLSSSQFLGQPTPSRACFHWDFNHSLELTDRDSIRRSHDLTPADRTALISFQEKAMRPLLGDSEDQINSVAELRSIAKETRVHLIDLNGDGKPEVVLQVMGIKAGCGATGNCPIWILERTASGYRSLIQRNTFSVQTFTIQSERNDGYRDVVLGMHDSATEQTLFLLRYKGGEYRRSGCYDAKWQVITNDSILKLQTPKITPCTRSGL